MTSNPTPEEIETAGEQAVALFLQQLGNSLSTGKFALVVEGIDLEGERLVYSCVAPGQTTWDTLGLLSFMETVQKGEVETGAAGED